MTKQNLEYDLERLFDHPLSFRLYLPSAIAVLGNNGKDECRLQCQWRQNKTGDSRTDELVICWDMKRLRLRFAELDEELQCVRERNEDQATQVEEAAVIVAVAVMAQLEPETRFTQKSSTGTRHDYVLNDSLEEMIEIAGRWQGGLPGLFDEKREQSDLNPKLNKRWVSVTIFRRNTRNQTEGLHS